MSAALSKVLLCVIVLITSGALPAGTQPQQSSPAQPRTNIMHLVSQTPVVEPDGDFAVRLRVVGVPSGARVHLEVRSRVPTRSDFKAALGGHVSRTVVGKPVEIAAVPDASGVVVATITTRDPQTLQPVDPQDIRVAEGVYPVTVDLISSSGA